MIVLDTNLAARSATTQYTNFNFDSMARFGNKYLAANESGLYEVAKSYDTDADTSIEAYFEIATINFSITSQKRLRAVYVTFESASDLTLKINTELSPVESYTIPASGAGQKTRKININRSLKGVHWTFQIYASNVDFSIDHISVLPIIRTHGVQGRSGVAGEPILPSLEVDGD